MAPSDIAKAIFEMPCGDMGKTQSDLGPARSLQFSSSSLSRLPPTGQTSPQASSAEIGGINVLEHASDSKEWDVFTRKRRPRKLQRVEVVLPTLKELRAHRSASLINDNAAKRPKAEDINITTSVKREPISDEQLQHAFNNLYKASLKEDIAPPQLPDPATPEGGSHVRIVYEEITDQQIRDALACINNSQAKVKKNLTFSDRILYRRLRQIGFEIYPIEDNVNKFFLFSRYYFSNRFGGSFVETFPTISAQKVREHGLDDWAFPSLEFNPHAPQVPGAPGLIYEPGGSVLNCEPNKRTCRMFVRLDAGKWLYVGMYTFVGAEPLTPQEFADQPAKMKLTWAQELKRQRGWGNYILARIFFRSRHQGRKPTKKEREQLMNNQTALNSVTDEQIIEAYSRGDEEFGVWSIKCIGYDTEWLAQLIDDYPRWMEEKAAEQAALKRVGKKRSRKGGDFSSGDSKLLQGDVKSGKRKVADGGDEEEGEGYLLETHPAPDSVSRRREKKHKAVMALVIELE
ncbi:uncharacterized protein PHACADRAFT_180986 [Phanerochaete carnosa HHB-10118-sp]|uniref:DUF6697 domain-containing protein n=1 Tax=Phanerochaete carnosa (strain HHB-10118-sp) TaxID=650164 RepID=K5V837_PHACS|nr:uncharacterized protein PHACADRAFT_180986 [Phanerochaete carnosa HHB-10118-sp]EKM58941.1 hypothetical protein PHACADRAFT_180986 [Phanerochaete carnosa HHB-10118-sp]